MQQDLEQRKPEFDAPTFRRLASRVRSATCRDGGFVRERSRFDDCRSKVLVNSDTPRGYGVRVRPLLSIVSPPRIPRDLSAVWVRAQPRRRLIESAPRRARTQLLLGISAAGALPLDPIPRNDSVTRLHHSGSGRRSDAAFVPIAAGPRPREAVQAVRR